jgi:tetratricopeptide (TPR) repeat protein
MYKSWIILITITILSAGMACSGSKAVTDQELSAQQQAVQSDAAVDATPESITVAPVQMDLQSRQRAELEREFQQRLNNALTHLNRAQVHFVDEAFEQALLEIMESIFTLATADAHVLAGSINYMMYRDDRAIEHWQEALQLNPDVRYTNYPGFQQWYSSFSKL